MHHPSARALHLLVLLLAACGSPEAGDPRDQITETIDAIAAFNINLWPNGQVTYKFDNGTAGPASISNADRTRVRNRMQDWEAATNDVITFTECTTACPLNTLTIRYNAAGQSGMACSPPIPTAC